MTSRIKFFKEAIKSLKTTGTVTPSSRYLAKRMLSQINFSKAQVIVELGPGNGVITEFILEKLPANATLICFEINDSFHKQLLKIKNPQLVVVKASAEKIKEELFKLGISNCNHIISSLPLTIIPEEVSNVILEKSHQVLKTNGTFIQYQYSLTYYKKLKKVFFNGISLDFEPFNIPPAFVYRCKKLD